VRIGGGWNWAKSCPTAVFSVCGVEPLDSTITMLVINS
jgi:hypothetical protein